MILMDLKITKRTQKIQASIFLLMSFLVFTFLFDRIIWKGKIYFSISPQVNYKKVSATACSFFTWLGYVFSHANNSNHHQKDIESFSNLTDELLNLSPVNLLIFVDLHHLLSFSSDYFP